MSSFPPRFAESPVAISIGGRMITSQSFRDLFREGMALVERAAAYLDGEGRSAAKFLPRALALAYTSESMRLTTRLMHIASWLLYQRALNEGELTPEEARADKAKMRFAAQELVSSGGQFEQLPSELQEICLQSLRIQQRIQHLELLLAAETTPDIEFQRPVNTLQRHLENAFPAHARGPLRNV